MRQLKLGLGLLVATCFLTACQNQESDMDTDSQTATTAATEGSDWGSIGFDAKEQRHSPLIKIMKAM